MTKKFTEEQYQSIIKAWQSENIYIHQTEAVIDCLIDDLNLSVTLIGDEALALANPVTREWAHDKFVEKEKRYVWRLKTNNSYRLTTHGGATQVNISRSSESLLTESEIKAWGYNPEMFDREEEVQ